jgi:hypothetical protein
MSRFFRRKKKDTDETEQLPEEEPTTTTDEAAQFEPEAPAEPTAEVAEPVPEGRGDIIPYHDSIQDRLVYMLNDSKMADGLEGTHEFMLEFMAMGERFWIRWDIRWMVFSPNGVSFGLSGTAPSVSALSCSYWPCSWN